MYCTVLLAVLWQDSHAAETFAEKRARVEAMAKLGEQLFADPRLSASGKLSCASCHDPAHAFTPANRLAVQAGGTQLDRQGRRAVPTLMYLQKLPPFSDHFHDDDGNDSTDAGPTGGLTWDGRVDSLAKQAAIPLLDPAEMANPDEASVVQAVRAAAYAPAFDALFGASTLNDTASGFAAITRSLQAYQENPAVFAPYRSRYDAWLKGRNTLNQAELRGLKLFNDPAKGNCASCHPSSMKNGSPPLFTDFGLIALGIPRNREILANRDPAYADLGVCGPLRTDLPQARYCGLFRTPTLRNVALKQRFMHNGIFTSLRAVVEFYAARETNPAKFYPTRKGRVQRYNDLPVAYRGNLNREAPFDRHPGDRPALTRREIDDLVAFLGSLTDRPTKNDK